MNNFIWLAILGLLLTGCGEESEGSRADRFRKDAPKLIERTISNKIVGITRIVEVQSDFYGDTRNINVTNTGEWSQFVNHPRNWKGKATVERINGVGGVERTNIFLGFGIYQDFSSGKERDSLTCYVYYKPEN